MVSDNIYEKEYVSLSCSLLDLAETVLARRFPSAKSSPLAFLGVPCSTLSPTSTQASFSGLF